MATIDSLLRVMVLRDAEAIVLVSGEVPKLRRNGDVAAMAMPALEPALVAAMVAEIVPADQEEVRGGRGRAEVLHRTEDGALFAILIEPHKHGHRLMARRRAAVRPAAPPPPTTPQFLEQLPPATPAAPLPDLAAAAPHAVAAVTPALDPVPHRHAVDDDAPADLPLPPLLARALSRGASDLLLSAGAPPRVRVAGQLSDLDPGADPLSDADILATLAPYLPAAGRAELDRTGSTDFAVDLRARGAGRCRINLFRHAAGLAAALRPVRERVPSLAELGLPDELHELTALPNGLVLVAGQAGAGKSTTLVALVEHLNRTRARHVITLEDPIEYRYTPQRCTIHQREIGVHVDSFATGLRAALRESPDVIVVGEMRDRETIAAALSAAETGHLVLATIHGSSAAVAIDRIIDVFSEEHQRQIRVQLGSVLRGILTQFLLPNRSGGRVPAYERMVVTAAVANLIRRNELHLLPSQVQTGREAGMVPLERTLAALLKSGTIDLAAARAVCPDPELLDDVVRTAGMRR